MNSLAYYRNLRTPQRRPHGIQLGMARFLQQFDPGRGDYTAERDRVLGYSTVDELMHEIERRRKNPPG